MKKNVKIALIIACAMVMVPAYGMKSTARGTQPKPVKRPVITIKKGVSKETSTAHIESALGPKPATKVLPMTKESQFATHAQVQKWSAAQAAQAPKTPQDPAKRKAVTLTSTKTGFQAFPDPRKIKTYYDVLGVPRTATQQELDAAWQARVRENAARATARGVNKQELQAWEARVKEAHDALINAKKRAAYDKTIGIHN